MILDGTALSKKVGTKQLVSCVSLHVKKGEIVGLLGPNGAGKTSTFLLMAGLLQPDEGCITLGDKDVTRWPLYRKARLGLRYLPQEDSVFKTMTVEDNLRAVLELTSTSAFCQAENLETLLEDFNLTALRHRPASVLSGGERRRVEIARALAGDPHFILLDEPLAGIDPKSVEDLQKTIRSLAARGIGILITDHNVREIFRLVHRAYVICEGRVLEEGAPEMLSQSPVVRSLYLGDRFHF